MSFLQYIKLVAFIRWMLDFMDREAKLAELRDYAAQLTLTDNVST